MNSRPLHRRFKQYPIRIKQTPSSFQSNRIDLSNTHLDPYPVPKGVADVGFQANLLFDGRAAASVIADVERAQAGGLLERKRYENLPFCLGSIIDILVLTAECLSPMAYLDYFPDDIQRGVMLRSMVSTAISQAEPGYCGSFGPDLLGLLLGGDLTALNNPDGNYDMGQMFLLSLVYNYYDELMQLGAADRLITVLLQNGIILRPNLPTINTSGGVPADWDLAGTIKILPAGILQSNFNIPETENHVLMIATARYLTNQLLYQRDTSHNPVHDNRRNGDPGSSRPSCEEQLVRLLRNYLRDDFSEYNAKSYQTETRRALLSLCSYSYDSEVRLGAKMVLDYISAHIAVSSNDLRRMVAFRRRNEEPQIRQDPPGFMDVCLLGGGVGADPIAVQFALLAGNTRALQYNSPFPWGIDSDFAKEFVLGALSDYRLPPSILDLFVNDLHRRFYQRIHRFPLSEGNPNSGSQWNSDNMEIYSGSPSYLITAGGEPAQHAIPGVNIDIEGLQLHFGWKEENIGVAVPISFMPTGNMKTLSGDISPADHPNPDLMKARQLIQLLRFSSKYSAEGSETNNVSPETKNYGVAPDFACGYMFHLPDWLLPLPPKDQDGIFYFVDKSTVMHQGGERAGFFLAIIIQENLLLLEAFDSWLHPETTFDQFRQQVKRNNPSVQLRSGQAAIYTTFFGNKIHFVIWNSGEIDNYPFGSKILNIEYGPGERADTLVDAGNYTDQSQTPFLSGNILKSVGEAVIEIHNPSLGTKIKLDWSDPSHLVRTSEDGTIEEAGKNELGELYEVWVDFGWNGSQDGDFYHPFNTLSSGLAALADGGSIRIMPGTTTDRIFIHPSKRIRLSAPIGGVIIGSH